MNSRHSAPPGDAEEPSLEGIDVEWDAEAEPSHETARPPAQPANAASGPDAHDVVDGAAALRSARTAASMGRVPTAAETAKISPFDLSQALARVTEDDG